MIQEEFVDHPWPSTLPVELHYIPLIALVYHSGDSLIACSDNLSVFTCCMTDMEHGCVSEDAIHFRENSIRIKTTA